MLHSDAKNRQGLIRRGNMGPRAGGPGCHFGAFFLCFGQACFCSLHVLQVLS